MNRNKTHSLIIVIITIACIGFSIVSFIERWEFWVSPVLVIGAAILWVLHVTQRMEVRYREMFYLLYGMFASFFYGMHETSFFDVAVVTMLMLVLYSLMDHYYMLNLILTEYAVIMSVQFTLALRSGSVVFSTINTSRVFLQAFTVLGVYLLSRITISNRREAAEVLAHRERDIESYDGDMEDFLSNISHELRTPINVVNGMSTLLIKKGTGAEAEAIREAGIRLSYQIEDIQDFTEIKRGRVVIEEENYMTTSLINDVVTGFRRYEDANELELVVDMDTDVPSMMRGDIRKLHKIFRHLLDNAVKFTQRGGVYIRVYAMPKAYGVNLCIEVTDTGCGMTRKDLSAVAKGLYQANKQRNRSTGGIGIGLPVVYGLSHAMGGFVKIESERGRGTTVRVTIPQKIVDGTPCLRLNAPLEGDVVFHVRSEKFKVPQVRDFSRNMAIHIAKGLKYPLYSAESVQEVERYLAKMNVAYIFMGQEEYEANAKYFDELSRQDIGVAVSAHTGFRPSAGSRVIVLPKPLYSVPVTMLLNEGKDACFTAREQERKPLFDGARALVVDDEPMNLVVATGLFRDYKMVTDTAESGREAIEKYKAGDYDIIFMDHMMPEMDGVEAMRRLREAAREKGVATPIVALTANAVSGAREMFLREGFDGFISKPINMSDFERIVKHVLPSSLVSYEGGDAK
ncbi:MAG: response regulator [Ruminococcaceae bacterium]|nr:response regulator [Oscillospiraceae bacterium]